MDTRANPFELAKGHPLYELQGEVSAIQEETANWLEERQPLAAHFSDYDDIIFEGQTKFHEILKELNDGITIGEIVNPQQAASALGAHIQSTNDRLAELTELTQMYVEIRGEDNIAELLPMDLKANIDSNNNIRANLQALVGTLPQEKLVYQDTVWERDDFVSRPDLGKAVLDMLQAYEDVDGKVDRVTERQAIDETGNPIQGLGARLILGKDKKES